MLDRLNGHSGSGCSARRREGDLRGSPCTSYYDIRSRIGSARRSTAMAVTGAAPVRRFGDAEGGAATGTGAVGFVENESGVTLKLPPADPETIDSVIVLEIEPDPNGEWRESLRAA